MTLTMSLSDLADCLKHTFPCEICGCTEGSCKHTTAETEEGDRVYVCAHHDPLSWNRPPTR